MVRMMAVAAALLLAGNGTYKVTVTVSGLN